MKIGTLLAHWAQLPLLDHPWGTELADALAAVFSELLPGYGHHERLLSWINPTACQLREFLDVSCNDNQGAYRLLCYQDQPLALVYRLGDESDWEAEVLDKTVYRALGQQILAGLLASVTEAIPDPAPDMPLEDLGEAGLVWLDREQGAFVLVSPDDWLVAKVAKTRAMAYLSPEGEAWPIAQLELDRHRWKGEVGRADMWVPTRFVEDQRAGQEIPACRIVFAGLPGQSVPPAAELTRRLHPEPRWFIHPGSDPSLGMMFVYERPAFSWYGPGMQLQFEDKQDAATFFEEYGNRAVAGTLDEALESRRWAAPVKRSAL